MKKVLLMLLSVVIALSFSIVAVGCGETDPEITLVLGQTTATLEVGDTLDLAEDAEVSGTSDAIVWTTSNDAVATVSDGTVTAIASGEATITASVGGKTATCTVTVLAERVTITKGTPANGTLTVEGGERVGDSVTITATANSGYELEELKIDGVAVTTTNGVYTFTATKSIYQVSATFSSLDVTLTVNGGEAITGGTVEVSEDLVKGDEATVTITAETGYQLKSITLDGADVTADVVDGVYTFTATSTAHAIVVEFEAKASVITVNGGETVANGSVSVTENVKWFDEVTVTLTPATGYKLKSITLDGADVTADVVDGVYTFTAGADAHAIVVEYEIKDIAITVNGGDTVEGGVVTVTENVKWGDTVTVTVTPNENVLLDYVKIDGVEVELTDGAYTFTAEKDAYAIEVAFIGETLAVNTSATNGTVTVETADPRFYTDITVSVEADTNYALSALTVDGVDVTASVVDGKYTFAGSKAEHEVNATFVRNITNTTSVAGYSTKIEGHSLIGANAFEGITLEKGQPFVATVTVSDMGANYPSAGFFVGSLGSYETDGKNSSQQPATITRYDNVFFNISKQTGSEADKYKILVGNGPAWPNLSGPSVVAVGDLYSADQTTSKVLTLVYDGTTYFFIVDGELQVAYNENTVIALNKTIAELINGSDTEANIKVGIACEQGATFSNWNIEVGESALDDVPAITLSGTVNGISEKANVNLYVDDEKKGNYHTFEITSASDFKLYGAGEFSAVITEGNKVAFIDDVNAENIDVTLTAAPFMITAIDQTGTKPAPYSVMKATADGVIVTTDYNTPYATMGNQTYAKDTILDYSMRLTTDKVTGIDGISIIAGNYNFAIHTVAWAPGEFVVTPQYGHGGFTFEIKKAGIFGLTYNGKADETLRILKLSNRLELYGGPTGKEAYVATIYSDGTLSLAEGFTSTINDAKREKLKEAIEGIFAADKFTLGFGSTSRSGEVTYAPSVKDVYEITANASGFSDGEAKLVQNGATLKTVTIADGKFDLVLGAGDYDFELVQGDKFDYISKTVDANTSEFNFVARDEVAGRVSSIMTVNGVTLLNAGVTPEMITDSLDGSFALAKTAHHFLPGTVTDKDFEVSFTFDGTLVGMIGLGITNGSSSAWFQFKAWDYQVDCNADNLALVNGGDMATSNIAGNSQNNNAFTIKLRRVGNVITLYTKRGNDNFVKVLSISKDGYEKTSAAGNWSWSANEGGGKSQETYAPTIARHEAAFANLLADSVEELGIYVRSSDWRWTNSAGTDGTTANATINFIEGDFINASGTLTAKTANGAEGNLSLYGNAVDMVFTREDGYSFAVNGVGSNGAFTANEVLAGTYTVTASHPNGATVTVNDVVVGEGAVSLTANILPETLSYANKMSVNGITADAKWGGYTGSGSDGVVALTGITANTDVLLPGTVTDKDFIFEASVATNLGSTQYRFSVVTGTKDTANLNGYDRIEFHIKSWDGQLGMAIRQHADYGDDNVSTTEIPGARGQNTNFKIRIERIGDSITVYVARQAGVVDAPFFKVVTISASGYSFYNGVSIGWTSSDKILDTHATRYARVLADTNELGIMLTSQVDSTTTFSFNEISTGTVSVPEGVTLDTVNAVITNKANNQVENRVITISNGAYALPLAKGTYDIAIAGDLYEGKALAVEVGDKAITIPAITLALKQSAITVNGGSEITGGSVDVVETSAWGETVTATVTADAGYEVASVKVNGETVSLTDNKYSFTVNAYEYAIAVEFALKDVTLTVNGGEEIVGGTVSVTEDVQWFESVTVEVAAATGYQIKSVKVDGVEVELTDGAYTFTAEKDAYAVEVAFELKSVTITKNAPANGTIEVVESAKWFDEITIKVTAEEGYGVQTITLNGEPIVLASDGTYTFEANADAYAIAVEFALKDVDVIVNGGEVIVGGTVTVTPNVKYGETATITVAPATGYQIKSVKVDGADVTLEEGAYSFTANNKEYAVEVVFELKSVTITKNAPENGTVEVVESAKWFDEITVTITPDTGYQVKSVKANEVAVEFTDGAYTFTAEADTYAVAVEFEAKSVTITVNDPANGSVSVTENAKWHSEVTIEVTPDANALVDYVKVDGVEVELTDNAYTFTAEKDAYSVEVAFIGETLTVNTSATNGTVTVETADPRYYADITVSVEADTNYALSALTVDGADVTASVVDGKYTFVGSKAEHEVNATFVRAIAGVSSVAGYTTHLTGMNLSSAKAIEGITLAVGEPFVLKANVRPDGTNWPSAGFFVGTDGSYETEGKNSAQEPVTITRYNNVYFNIRKDCNADNDITYDMFIGNGPGWPNILSVTKNPVGAFGTAVHDTVFEYVLIYDGANYTVLIDDVRQFTVSENDVFGGKSIKAWINGNAETPNIKVGFANEHGGIFSNWEVEVGAGALAEYTVVANATGFSDGEAQLVINGSDLRTVTIADGKFNLILDKEEYDFELVQGDKFDVLTKPAGTIAWTADFVAETSSKYRVSSIVTINGNTKLQANITPEMIADSNDGTFTVPSLGSNPTKAANTKILVAGTVTADDFFAQIDFSNGASAKTYGDTGFYISNGTNAIEFQIVSWEAGGKNVAIRKQYGTESVFYMTNSNVYPHGGVADFHFYVARTANEIVIYAGQPESRSKFATITASGITLAGDFTYNNNTALAEINAIASGFFGTDLELALGYTHTAITEGCSIDATLTMYDMPTGTVTAPEGVTIESAKAIVTNTANNAVEVIDITVTNGAYALPITEGTYNIELVSGVYANKKFGITVTENGATIPVINLVDATYQENGYAKVNGYTLNDMPINDSALYEVSLAQTNLIGNTANADFKGFSSNRVYLPKTATTENFTFVLELNGLADMPASGNPLHMGGIGIFNGQTVLYLGFTNWCGAGNVPLFNINAGDMGIGIGGTSVDNTTPIAFGNTFNWTTAATVEANLRIKVVRTQTAITFYAGPSDIEIISFHAPSEGNDGYTVAQSLIDANPGLTVHGTGNVNNLKNNIANFFGEGKELMVGYYSTNRTASYNYTAYYSTEEVGETVAVDGTLTATAIHGGEAVEYGNNVTLTLSSAFGKYTLPVTTDGKFNGNLPVGEYVYRVKVANGGTATGTVIVGEDGIVSINAGAIMTDLYAVGGSMVVNGKTVSSSEGATVDYDGTFDLAKVSNHMLPGTVTDRDFEFTFSFSGDLTGMLGVGITNGTDTAWFQFKAWDRQVDCCALANGMANDGDMSTNNITGNTQDNNNFSMKLRRVGNKITLYTKRGSDDFVEVLSISKDGYSLDNPDAVTGFGWTSVKTDGAQDLAKAEANHEAVHAKLLADSVKELGLFIRSNNTANTGADGTGLPTVTLSFEYLD